MPTLNHLTCHVEWPTSNIPFQEYGISYGNGVVESHIAVPPSSTPFAISLQSTSFISSGLAVFVYIDGVYQCNRNRCDLKSPKRTDNPNDTGTMVEFRVRQKEVFLPNGDWIGRPWKFEPLELGTTSSHEMWFPYLSFPYSPLLPWTKFQTVQSIWSPWINTCSGLKVLLPTKQRRSLLLWYWYWRVPLTWICGIA